jgi:hypothetical protein
LLLLLKQNAVLWRVTLVEIRAVEYVFFSPVIWLIKPSIGLPCLLVSWWNPSTTSSPGLQKATDVISEVVFVVARFPSLKYKFGSLTWFGLDNIVFFCTPVETWIIWGPDGLGGCCVPISLLFIIGTSLQNSTDETKKPSNGPFWHSYLFTLVG